jgi:hypothetical protein
MTLIIKLKEMEQQVPMDSNDTELPSQLVGILMQSAQPPTQIPNLSIAINIAIGIVNQMKNNQ